MYRVFLTHKAHGAIHHVDTNNEANALVDEFLSARRPSMWTYCIVTNTTTNKRTKVWRGVDGSKKHAVM